jgi:hypothetical protein
MIDMIDDYADVAGPIGAFIGIALAIGLCVIGAK